jgi:hypothetical protein
VDTVFRVGDQVLLRAKELLDAVKIGKLRPLWAGPPAFRVAAVAGPNMYTLDLLSPRESHLYTGPVISSRIAVHRQVRSKTRAKKESMSWSNFSNDVQSGAGCTFFFGPMAGARLHGRLAGAVGVSDHLLGAHR